MPLTNLDSLRFPGSAPTTGGTSAPGGDDTSSASAWLQQQPWYQQALASWGNPKTLSLGQRGYLARTAIKSGMNSNYGVSPDGTVEDWSTPTAAKIALAAFAAAAPFGSSLSSGAQTSVQIPGGEFDPSMVYGGANGPTQGIPPSFGQTAVDSVNSQAPRGAGLPDWLKTAQDVGDALSKTSVGRAQGRLGEANANQQQARAAVDLYNSQLEAPSVIGRNAVRGDILSNARDATISGVSPNIPVPTISGGLRPSMFSDATRQAGTSISNNARDSAAALTVPKVPVLPDLPQASGLDQFLNTGSSVANILGAAKPVLSKIPWGSIFG